jgi:hypothetical protein
VLILSSSSLVCKVVASQATRGSVLEFGCLGPVAAAADDAMVRMVVPDDEGNPSSAVAALSGECLRK